MRGFLIAFLVGMGFLCAKSVVYSPEVVALYLHPEDSKVVGKLLPTNGFEVLQSTPKRVLISLEGYVNPKAPFALYFNDHQRILVAAFAKNTPLEFKSKETSKVGKWDKVRLEVWADKKDFVSSDTQLFSHAKELFTNNCGTCHALHATHEFNANAWPSIFKSMASRTGIDKKDHWLVIEYLQKNAKDSKNP
ncbi:cytochrome c3 family protein [Helicobacter bizzozeronii]|uniref:cytochrome c3 family protein n=1 Tax=Helicobacter bizzozeronii TaxID=56877 RepID=UPI000CEEF26C|nr:cytochrome c3 family protein [Helicobacter bizzozeronii]